MQLKMLLKILLFLFLLLSSRGEPSNVANTSSLGWKSPSQPSIVLCAYFGAPGGRSGPGAPSVDVFISVHAELPDNWVDAPSVQAAVSHEVEVEAARVRNEMAVSATGSDHYPYRDDCSCSIMANIHVSMFSVKRNATGNEQKLQSVNKT